MPDDQIGNGRRDPDGVRERPDDNRAGGTAGGEQRSRSQEESDDIVLLEQLQHQIVAQDRRPGA